LFKARVERSPEQTAYQQYLAETDTWESYTWNDIYQQVCRWRQALQQENLQPGDRVATVVGNCIEWGCFEQAAQSLGLVTVALYTTDTEDNIAFILADAGVRLLMVDTLDTWNRLADQCESVTGLQSIWCLQKNQHSSALHHQQLKFVSNLLPKTAQSSKSYEPDEEAVATIIYTSGTTGKPKGVMLSHHNLLSNAEAVQKRIPAYPEDIFLSFLPLAHGFERTVEYVLPMMAGSCVTYARSISQLREDLVLVRPTVFISAPRLYEKIYVAIQEKVAESWVKHKLFDWTVSLGWKQFLARQRRGPQLNLLQKIFLALLKSLVSKKVLDKLGGRMRVAVTGAAPLSAKVSRFFIGLGLPLLEGYGLTEAGPVVSGNNPEDNVPGSVGKPLPGVEVKLANDGELLVHSPGVMLGYWQHEQATQEVIDQGNWLHTGDLAEIIDDHIYIKGRSKEIIVTSTGEKVAPADIEAAIVLDPLFENAMVIGEGKPFISALLVLNSDAWNRIATELGLDPEDKGAFAAEKVHKALLQKLAILLRRFPVYAQVRAVYLMLDSWTIENGLLTPTLKIKRHVIEKQYANEIKELYRGHVLID
ncbi:MAG: long-chain fatty acid--CoA ligase, partial [Thioalkalispiraceae bacterium]